jgi:DNA-binding LacI/PurR family transcriptional regulator
MRIKRTTIQDLADHCELSKSTVAYVLREPVTCKASKVTKSKVASAVRKLNYKPNPAARALSTRRYRTIGVLMPPLSGYYVELMKNLDREMKAHGFYAIFSFWELDSSGATKMNSFKRAVLELSNHGIDGIITTENDVFLLEMDIPIVVYGNKWPSFDCVFPDKVTYMQETVEYLYQHGCRKIGFFGLTHEIRAKALREELYKYKLPVNEEWFIYGVGSPACGESNMRKLLSLDECPDAIILHSDFMMSGVLTAADEAGIKIPEDISIISYGNLLESKYFRPPLTTFDECLGLAAKMLTKTILKRIECPQEPPRQLSYKMPLIERKSVTSNKPIKKTGGTKNCRKKHLVNV